MIVPGATFGFIPPHNGAGDIDVVCSACRSRAIFTKPYGFIADATDADARLPGVQIYGGFAVERFPEAFPWRDPDNPWVRGLGRENWGVMACPHCGRRRKHRLNWPKDAFYQVHLSIGLLWAYSRDHLVRIRRHVAGDRSPESRFEMNRLPKVFILLRNRDKVLKAIDRLLSAPDSKPDSAVCRVTRR